MVIPEKYSRSGDEQASPTKEHQMVQCYIVVKAMKRFLDYVVKSNQIKRHLLGTSRYIHKIKALYHRLTGCMSSKLQTHRFVGL